jgi:hypothetical protein
VSDEPTTDSRPNGDAIGPTNGGNGHADKYLPSYDELRTLETSVLLGRLQFARQAGLTFNGDRDLYAILGYDRVITPQQYRDEYARGGIAKRIVNAFPKATWRGGVTIFEDEDPKTETVFEAAWRELETRLKIWWRFQQVDTLSGLSTYAILLLGDGNADMTVELKRGKPGGLLYVQPYTGGAAIGTSTQISAAFVDASIKEYETDVRNRRFGQPKFYQLRRTDFTTPALQQAVHWSRVVHVAEGTLDNDVFGEPALECVWNLLADLQKVTGGGAEAFWLRANAGLHLNIDKDMTVAPSEAELAKLRQDVEDYKHNITRILRTRGVDVSQLGSDVANFGNPADAILRQIAGTKGIPLRILTGSEMGELASSQDADNWRTQIQDRRTGYAEPTIVRPFIDRLIEYGYLPKPKAYHVAWPEANDQTPTDKMGLVVNMAEVNKTQGTMVFLPREMRELLDYEPLTPEDEAQPVGPPPPAALPVGLPPAALPVGALPNPTGDDNDEDDDDDGLRAAEDELVRVLAEAIESRDRAVIDRILGLTRA